MIFGNICGEPLFIHKIILKLGGLWPPDNGKFGPLIVYTMHSAFKVTILLAYLIDTYENTRPRIRSYMTMLYTIVSLSAQFTVWINSDRVTRLIESTINDWSSIANTEKHLIMKQHEQFGTSFFVVSILFYAVVPFVRDVIYFPFLTSGKLSSEHQTALDDHYTWIATISVLTIVHGIINNLICCSGVMLFCGLAIRLSGQFKILGMDFQKFSRIRSKEVRRKEFRRLVDRHNELLDLSSDLQKSFAVYTAIGVLFCQMYICYKAHQLAVSMLNGNWKELVEAVLTIGVFLWNLFLYYYSGEYLTTCCEKIGDVLLQCEPYNLSKDSKMNISIVILQSRKPKTLTVLGLYRLNFSNYKHLLDTVYSYISLILAITEEE